MNGGVYALAISGCELYAGGAFTMAGGKISTYSARAFLEQPALFILRSGATATVSWPAFYEQFVLQETPDLTNANSWSAANYPLTTNGSTKSAAVPFSPTKQFFRLIGVE